MNTNEKNKDTYVITPKGRLSFPNLFKPVGFQGQEPKYSLQLLFDKTTDLSALKKAAHAAATAKWGAKQDWPKNLRMPFKDGDSKSELQGYAGTIFISPTSKQKPQVVDKNKQEILDASEVYGGCYVRVSLKAFAYDNLGNKGVSFGLQNVQKLADGESFSGRKRAEDEFDAVMEDNDTVELDEDDFSL